MKAKSNPFYRHSTVRVTSTAVMILCDLLYPLQRVGAADILRPTSASGTGSTGTASTGSVAPTSVPTGGTTRDSLARTALAIQEARNLQITAQQIAKAKADNRANTNPSGKNTILPTVPDGLGEGGLDAISGSWTGAETPTQTTTSGGTLAVTIKQTAQSALLNWKTFNVGKNTALTFDQSAGGENKGEWIAYNIVKDPNSNPTQILGSIKADGQVYIINQNGIVFSGTSQVNTHTLVASALPINSNLIANGLLNNPDGQFLFSALDQIAGTNSSAVSSGVGVNDRVGDVVVEAGAQLSAPTTSAHVGGRIALIGANVTNAGTISTPDGQTILAAGLQVGVVAHDSTDASLRGLDVYIGAVTNPASTLSTYAGTVTNSGIIDSARANITLAGKTIEQNGIINSSTSVSLNGRIDLNASYGAISNIAYDATQSSFGPRFLNYYTGEITLGAGSVTQVVPEYDSTETVTGTKLALNSQINLTGSNIHLENDSIILAQGGDVTVNAGSWLTTPSSSSTSPPVYEFLRDSGRIDVDAGAVIDVSGSEGVQSSVSSNIVEVKLAGTELADNALNKDGALRGATIYVDITKTGTYNGETWVGTPLADVSGYVALVQRTVGELTSSGGTVNLNAGGAVVIREGATIDVSGGSVDYVGGMVKTSRVVASNGQVYDISTATPDRVYSGVVGQTFSVTSSKWGKTSTYASPLSVSGYHYEAGYTQGGNGGALNIKSGAVALDGTLKGGVTVGTHQTLSAPTAATLSLNFTSERLLNGQIANYYPNAPEVKFVNESTLTVVGDYEKDSSGAIEALSAERLSQVQLKKDLFGEDGFGNVSILNSDGDIEVASGVTLDLGNGGSLSLSGANIAVNGSILSAGGTVSLKAYNLSQEVVDAYTLAATDLPAAAVGRGVVSLGSDAVIDLSGEIIDDRPLAQSTNPEVFTTKGGSLTIGSYSSELSAGSVIDVSGGAYISGTGKVSYGNAGSISVQTGADLNLKGVTGGHLNLGSELRGYSGATGGSLSLQATSIYIGTQAPTHAASLWLTPDFFNQGGFSKFSLAGVGEVDAATSKTIAGVTVADGTVISPVVKSLVLTDIENGQTPELQQIIQPEGLRSLVSISLSSSGVVNDFTRALIARGEVYIGAGSKIEAGALGTISLSGNTVEVHGNLYAAGGTIKISGANAYPSLSVLTTAYTTVLIGSDAVVDASGASLLVPDSYGRRRGAVLDGGSIKVSGNIVAETGAVLDVSGASGTLDLLAGETGKSLDDIANSTSGTTKKPYATSGKSTLIESNGGTISLAGGEMLLTDATLKGSSGGKTGAGGTLQLSSGFFVPVGGVSTPLDPTLIVSQSGKTLPNGYIGEIGTAAPSDATGVLGGGRFSVDSFTAGGFSNLDLAGTVKFSGPVSIHAAGRITAGSSAVLLADSDVVLDASYVSLGTAFQAPKTTEEEESYQLATVNGSQFFMPPTHGSSTLSISADLIDVGYLALRGIGTANLTAENGDVRGSGAFEVAGDINIKAGQIYSPTASSFTIAAFDYTSGSVAKKGSVNITASGTRSLPLSAGSTLSIYASIIHQDGVLRAPYGTINLGWDGSGTAPHDGQLSNLDYATTSELVLGSHSVTSVSAIDPISGKAVTIPYGYSEDGSTWLDPHGEDITSSGLPQKAIHLSAESVTTEAGSSVDIRGGGDLLAYQWVNGLGGTTDILESTGAFAIIPSYGSAYAPYATYNASLGDNAGYSNSTLKVGDQIRIDGGKGIPAGVYTLLPARYALLSGAYLVTPLSGSAIGTVAKADGSTIVSGYRFNGLDSALQVPSIANRFEVASSSTVLERAEYNKISANSFFASLNYRLPGDAGQLVYEATKAMAIQGSVQSAAASGYRGGLIDISSPVDIYIGSDSSAAPANSLVLDPSLLDGFGAESLLIGGTRSTQADGTLVTANTTNLTVDNQGEALLGSEIILVAKNTLLLADGAEIRQSGKLSGSADTLILGVTGTSGSGNSSLFRVSSDASASLIRRAVTTSNTSSLVVGANAQLKGTSLTFDSSALNQISASAVLDTQALSIGSGRISLLLDSSLTPGTDAGLVLTQSTLNSLSNAQALSLSSYSSIDILGAGSIGALDSSGKPVLQSLTLHTGEIHGIGLAGGKSALNAQSITLDNSSSASAGTFSNANSGTLQLNADTVTLGNGNVGLKGFTLAEIDASKSVKATGTGKLSSSSGLSIDSPVLYTSQTANYTLAAAGALNLLNTGKVSTGTISDAGLGGKLTLGGSTVNLASRIVLPSGTVSATASTGNLTVDGTIEVAGYSKKYNDVTAYTDAGSIALTSTLGNLVLGQSGVLDVSAKSGGGDAGTVKFSATSGTVQLNGSLKGTSGSNGDSGSFSMDVGSLAQLASLDTALNQAGFNLSRDYRIRTGNVLIDGSAQAQNYQVVADQGSVTLTGSIDASGKTGGTVRLVANQGLSLESGSHIDVSGKNFSSAGKGGSITLETRGVSNGTLNLKNGSVLDLGVDAWNSSSSSLGQFQGTLHLRAPRNAANTDLAVDAINSQINNASSIFVEGYKVYDTADFGGLITPGVQNVILNSDKSFLGASGTTVSNYTAMMNRLTGSNSAIRSQVILSPGDEVINSATASTISLSLNSANSTIATPSTGGSITFPSGSGASRIRVSTAATLTTASGTSSTVAAGTTITVEAGSVLSFAGTGTVTYASGTGAIALALNSGTSYTTSATGTTGTITTRGSMVTLNTATTSSLALASGAVVTLPNGTPGTNVLRATSAGKITNPDGTTTTFNANTSFSVTAGSYVSLNNAGTLTFYSGSGGAFPVALASGSMTSSGPVTLAASTPDITLGTATGTFSGDWNLATARFGPNGAAGFLTIRGSSNIVLYNSITDGFTNGSYTSSLLARNSLLPENAQSWSINLVAGADFTSADEKEAKPLANTATGAGSILIGRNGYTASVSGGANALTSTLLNSTTAGNLYQVIRTGSGDIDLVAARDIQLLNNFVSVYTAGTLVADATLGGTFDVPKPNMNGSAVGSLGAIQQSTAAAVQYTMAGGNVSLTAGNNIGHYTRTALGELIADSSRQMPTNWLYRRGYVDSTTGQFGTSNYGETASTTWWVDFTNFFEGVGALGGGNVTLNAGQNVSNVDAVSVTNARMAKGTPSASKLVELGGGDVTVIAANNIDAGVYYVERGQGTLKAGNSIVTNSTRTPSLGNLSTSSVLDSRTWLATTLFAGDAQFDVSAAGDVLLGPVANPFLLPQGYNNTYWYKTWFSTYTDDTSVSVSSLGGDVTLRTQSNAVPALQAWYSAELLLTTNPASASYFQPWLRLSESSVSAFSSGFSLMPGSLSVTSFTGGISLVGNLTLSPTHSGNLDLLSAESINGLQISGTKTVNSVVQNQWASSVINFSDADPASIPGVASPRAYQGIVGSTSTANRQTNSDTFSFLTALFAETGSTDGTTQSKQVLHTSGLLHKDDDQPVRIYAEGDISDLELYSAKVTRIMAGQDIRDIAFYLQNLGSSDISLVSAGRDIIAYDTTTTQQGLATASGNVFATGTGVRSGDIQISGPGTLEVLAGRNLDLGLGGNNSDGTGTGITSIGNSRNPYLGFTGADIITAAGVQTGGGLDAGSMDFASFITKFIKTDDGTKLLKEIGLTQEQFDALGTNSESQNQKALDVFYLVLRDAGRNHNDSTSDGYGNYDSGLEAIATLFPGSKWAGNIQTRSRDIRTKNGGDISVFAPGGSLTLATTSTGNTLAPPGIITESGGNINIFTDKNVDLGISRIFTLKGGNEIIWSSKGNIAAGSSSKTVQSAPPTRVLIDPQSANVKTDLAGLATGGGIGVLTTVAGVAASDVDLIAPVGTIDAGDAGIRVSGNLNIAAAVVTNTGNISVGGASSGTPSTSVSAPNLGGLSASAAAANSGASSVSESSQKDSSAGEQAITDVQSLITVEVIGYGGEDEDDEDKADYQ
jgi:filamentous hemagglutinin